MGEVWSLAFHNYSTYDAPNYKTIFTFEWTKLNSSIRGRPHAVVHSLFTLLLPYDFVQILLNMRHTFATWVRRLIDYASFTQVKLKNSNSTDYLLQCFPVNHIRAWFPTFPALIYSYTHCLLYQVKFRNLHSHMQCTLIRVLETMTM